MLNPIYVKIIALVAVLMLGAWWFVEQKSRGTGGVVCTMEALMCPDGSGVGRQGTTCSFSACPNQDSFTGELNKDSVGYRLIIASPMEAGRLATYAMPLEFKTTDAPENLVGRTVTVKGIFTEGNHLAVESLEASSPEESGAGWQRGVVRIGETKLINRVKVTLHDIEQDSRCPTDVQCIRAGNVTARVTLVSDTDSETLDMLSDADSHAFDSFTISIVDVAPLPTARQPIESSLYNVTFQVEDLK
ncbi:MAG: hypothetical protein ACYCZ7_00930 [Minisyncoccota bacterium]